MAKQAEMIIYNYIKLQKIRTCSSIHIHEGTDAKIIMHSIALEQ